MSFSTIADMAKDRDLLDRCAACAATEGIDRPLPWTYERGWKLAAQPGWASAYESAITNNIESPGRDASVISDAMILAGVQAVILAEPVPDPIPDPPEEV